MSTITLARPTIRSKAAACLVSLYGDGATIRKHHGPVVFTEGVDEADGYDAVASLVYSRT